MRSVLRRLVKERRFSLTEKQIEKMKEEIKALSDEEVIKVYKFAPFYDPYFRRDLPLFEIFSERLDKVRNFCSQGKKDKEGKKVIQIGGERETNTRKM